MKLNELKALVKEEYDRFMYEQEDEEKDKKDDKEKDDAPKGGDDKAKGGDDKAKGGDSKPKAPKAPKVDVGVNDLDLEGEESPEETLRAIYDMFKAFFEGDKEAPKDDVPAGMDLGPAGPPPPPAGGPGDMMALQERFKKLANIIK